VLCVFLIWEHGGLQWELYFLWGFFMKVKEGVVDVFKILGFDVFWFCISSMKVI